MYGDILIDDRNGAPYCSLHDRTNLETLETSDTGSTLYVCPKCHAQRWVGI